MGDAFIRDKGQLKQLQSLPLEAKVVLTQQRIREWYEHFGGDVFVSFSGGKDSTVLAHLVHGMYPEVPLVFDNTGLEFPEIQAFARDMGAEVIRPKISFSEVISTYGYPIISKENSEAIQYARRIRNSSADATHTHGPTELRKRTELCGSETMVTSVVSSCGGGVTNNKKKQTGTTGEENLSPG